MHHQQAVGDAHTDTPTLQRQPREEADVIQVELKPCRHVGATHLCTGDVRAPSKVDAESHHPRKGRFAHSEEVGCVNPAEGRQVLNEVEEADSNKLAADAEGTKASEHVRVIDPEREAKIVVLLRAHGGKVELKTRDGPDVQAGNDLDAKAELCWPHDGRAWHDEQRIDPAAMSKVVRALVILNDRVLGACALGTELHRNQKAARERRCTRRGAARASGDPSGASARRSAACPGRNTANRRTDGCTNPSRRCASSTASSSPATTAGCATTARPSSPNASSASTASKEPPDDGPCVSDAQRERCFSVHVQSVSIISRVENGPNIEAAASDPTNLDVDARSPRDVEAERLDRVEVRNMYAINVSAVRVKIRQAERLAKDKRPSQLEVDEGSAGATQCNAVLRILVEACALKE
mmetsp:Transcript_20499/g.65975  ORF Transcript_20499/g.65975 Transcript_20499/m.65975 type:complete len:410 (-) Transcript_20499:207-1436(-)